MGSSDTLVRSTWHEEALDHAESIAIYEREARLAFDELDFRGTTLGEIGDLRGPVIWDGVNFTDADLLGVVATNGLLEGANFTEADLRAADFFGADLRNAIFRGADLRHASFRFANIAGADFTDALLPEDVAAFTCAKTRARHNSPGPVGLPADYLAHADQTAQEAYDRCYAACLDGNLWINSRER